MNIKPDIGDALLALKPNSEFAIEGNTYADVRWLDKNQTIPTEDVVNAKVTELVNAYPMKLLREERTRKLSESDWMANSDYTMSDEWKTYRQALRDLPANSSGATINQTTGRLEGVTWPTKPS